MPPKDILSEAFHSHEYIDPKKDGIMRKKTLFTVFLIFSLQLIVMTSTVFAYKQKIVPSIGLKETYDTKVGYEDDEDFVHSIIPGLIYNISNESTQVNFSGLMDISWYSAQEEYNGVDQTYILNLDHRYSERIKFGIKNDFAYDSNSKKSFETTGENLETADRILYGVSPYLTFDFTENTRAKVNYQLKEINYQGYTHNDDYSDSTTNSFGIGTEHDISERTSIGLNTSADLRSYDKEGGKNHEDHYKISMLTKHKLNERTKIRLSISGDQYYENDVDEDSDTDYSVNVSAGMTHEINERLKVDLFLGTGDQTTFDDSGSLGAELTWIGEQWNLAGGYKKDITSGSRGYDLKRDRVYAKGAYNFSEKITSGFQGVYVYSNETDSGDDDEQKYTYYSLEPYLQYEIIKNSFIKTGYSYGVYEDRDDDDTVTRNQIYVMYTMIFPYDK